MGSFAEKQSDCLLDKDIDIRRGIARPERSKVRQRYATMRKRNDHQRGCKGIAGGNRSTARSNGFDCLSDRAKCGTQRTVDILLGKIGSSE